MRASGVSCLILSLILTGCGAGSTEDPGSDPAKLASIVVTASKTTLAANESLELTASGKDERGEPVELDEVTWSSSNQAVVTVDSLGVATAVGSGAVTVTATSGGKSSSLALTVQGAIHYGGRIESSETWREADNPHIVLGDVEVEGPGTPVLTIEAGVVARFAQDAAIEVGRTGEGGTLRIQGTAEKPVTLTTNANTPAPGQWQGVYFQEGSTASSMAHTVVEYCGSSSGDSSMDACIIVAGATARPILQDVTVRQSVSQGIALGYGGAFGPGSKGLKVMDVQTVPVSLEVDQVGSLPGDSVFTSNGRNVVRVSGGQVSRSQTWANVGIPYAMESSFYVEGATTPTLTLSPGVTLRFARSAYFQVGTGEGGNLRASGTVEEPITFTADAEFPAAGHWQGLTFGEYATSASKLTHVVIEYGGDVGGHGGYGDANVGVIGDKGAFITQTTLRHSSACGIVRASPPGHGGFVTDFTASGHGNVFSDNVNGNQCGP